MAVLHYDSRIIFYSSIAFSIAGFVGLSITFYVLNKISGDFKKATKIKPASIINFEYFLAYIIPFVAIDIDSMRQLLAYGILFVFIGLLYIRTELIYVNPTLSMLGYNLFKIEADNENIVLITKNSYQQALSNPIVPIGNDLYYERRPR